MINKKAFTLIETLIVLVIVSFLVVCLSFLPKKNWVHQIESKLFFDQLKSELNLAQEAAIIQGYSVSVHFQEDCVQFRSIGSIMTYKRLDYPSEWKVTSPFSFIYGPTGRVLSFRTVRFQNSSTNSIVNIVFQLGSGKFEIRGQ